RMARRTTTAFPRPHPPRPPSPRCSRSDRRREFGRDRRYSTRVLRCTTPRPERRVEGGRDGWAFGNPSSYVVTGVPLTDIQADGETVRSGFRRPARLSRPANGQSGFELRHYPLLAGGTLPQDFVVSDRDPVADARAV